MQAVFRGVTDQGVVMEWYAPQTLSRVKKNFKFFCEMEDCKGFLYCGRYLIMETGRWSDGRLPAMLILGKGAPELMGWDHQDIEKVECLREEWPDGIFDVTGVDLLKFLEDEQHAEEH